MLENFGKSFFQALKTEAEIRLGADHPCTLAISRAAETGRQPDIENAQKHMSELRENEMEPLMAAVHKAMREDPSALLGAWSGGKDTERAN